MDKVLKTFFASYYVEIPGLSNKPWDELPVLPMDKVNTLMLSTASFGKHTKILQAVKICQTLQCTDIEFRGICRVGNNCDPSSARKPTSAIHDVQSGSKAGWSALTQQLLLRTAATNVTIERMLSGLQAKLVITELRTRMRPRQPDDEVPTVSSVLVAGMRELAGVFGFVVLVVA
jgi:hypothetical protein